MKIHNLNDLYSGHIQKFSRNWKKFTKLQESICNEVHFNLIVDIQYLC